MPKLIIPAAGFGRRVGSPEAKEMILGPEGKPMIDWALDLARVRGWPVHVVTRAEKLALIEHLEIFSREHQAEIKIQIIESSNEWTESVLFSEAWWDEQNLLVLPDTRFSPVQVLERLANELTQVELAFAGHEVMDGRQWGMLAQSANELWVAEKPKAVPERLRSQELLAWGVIAFTKTAGKSLFAGLDQSRKEEAWQKLPYHFSVIKLDHFCDLTRE